MIELPLNVDELAIVFGYKNRRGVNRAIRMGSFPVPTFVSETGQRMAHRDHVNAYLERKKAEAEQEWRDDFDEEWSA